MAEQRSIQTVADGAPPQYNVPGLVHETLAGPAQGMRTLEVWRQRVAPGGGTPVHRHNCEEVFVILAGRGTIKLLPPDESGQDAEDIEAQPFMADTTVIVAPGVVHQVVNTGATELVYLSILGMSPVKLETAAGDPVSRPWLEEQPR